VRVPEHLVRQHRRGAVRGDPRPDARGVPGAVLRLALLHPVRRDPRHRPAARRRGAAAPLAADEGTRRRMEPRAEDTALRPPGHLPMKLLLVRNPGSRHGRGPRRWAFWEDGCGGRARRSRRRRPGASTTRAASPARRRVRHRRGGRRRRYHQRRARRAGRRRRPGTAHGRALRGNQPDFCRFHGIPVEPAPALAALLAGHVRRVDVVAIRHGAPGGPPTRGSDAVAASAWARRSPGRPTAGGGSGRRGRHRAGRTARHRAFAAGRPRGRDRRRDDPAARDLAPRGPEEPLDRVRPAARRRPRAGRRPRQRPRRHRSRPRRTARAAPAFYTGSAVRARGVFLREGRRVRVRSRAACAVEFDGDPRGHLPVEAEVRPGLLELVRP